MIRTEIIYEGIGYLWVIMTGSNLIKKLILTTAFEANKGHIGSSLSVADLVAACTRRAVNDNNVDLVLSKGHAALAFYCALRELGKITEEELRSYCGERTLYGTHPDPAMPFVNFMGGSLGQGLSFAVGKSMSYKNNFATNKIVVILSDSELNSGVFWESIAIASSNKLKNLIVLMDNNKQQALGLTKDVIRYPDIEQTIKSLGWNVSRIDGHDLESIENELDQEIEKPKFVIADTKFGSGISFMDGKIEWHYLPLNKEQYETAMKEIDK